MSKTAPRSVSDSCAALQLEDGDVIIYNPKNPPAWLQSDLAVRLDDAR